MRILIIGGTRFAGRALTELALSRGHAVTLFHRGHTGAELFPTAEHRFGDRDHDLSKLDRGEWEATIDFMAYAPRQVEFLARSLGGRGGHYALVSTGEVYAHPAPYAFTEDAPLVELTEPVPESFDRIIFRDPARRHIYGGLKALCERAARAEFRQGALIARSTFMIGPHDPSGRFGWWVRRIAEGGEVLAPGPADVPLQVIDARDFGRFVLDLVERRSEATLHAATPQPPCRWGDLLETIVEAVGPPGTRLTWVDAEFLLAEGQNEHTLPLWRAGSPHATGYAMDASAALRAGLNPRPIAESVRDVLAHEREHPSPMVNELVTPDGREAELLARWRKRMR